MKQQIETVISVCDFCHAENTYHECIACKKDICYDCKINKDIVTKFDYHVPVYNIKRLSEEIVFCKDCVNSFYGTEKKSAIIVSLYNYLNEIKTECEQEKNRRKSVDDKISEKISVANTFINVVKYIDKQELSKEGHVSPHPTQKVEKKAESGACEAEVLEAEKMFPKRTVKLNELFTDDCLSLPVCVDDEGKVISDVVLYHVCDVSGWDGKYKWVSKI